MKVLSFSSESIRTTQETDWVTASPSQESSSTTTTPAQNLSTPTTSEAPTPMVEEVAAPVTGATARNNSMINITAQLGSSVFLTCVTHHSMERQVRRASIGLITNCSPLFHPLNEQYKTATIYPVQRSGIPLRVAPGRLVERHSCRLTWGLKVIAIIRKAPILNLSLFPLLPTWLQSCSSIGGASGSVIEEWRIKIMIMV